MPFQRLTEDELKVFENLLVRCKKNLGKNRELFLNVGSLCCKQQRQIEELENTLKVGGIEI